MLYVGTPSNDTEAPVSPKIDVGLIFWVGTSLIKKEDRDD